MSQTTDFKNQSFDEFQRQLQGIYSASITERTLDELLMVYKNKDEIVSIIFSTADNVKTIKSVYNFKAME